MDAKTIAKYKHKTIPKLLATATEHFNKFIRLRDTDENGFGRCISSGQPLKVPSQNAQAGHFISAGECSGLRFNEDNVHLQGKSDNYFKSGNQLHYRENLIKKIGLERVEDLEMQRDYYKRTGFKWDRFSVIEIIEKYKKLNRCNR